MTEKEYKRIVNSLYGKYCKETTASPLFLKLFSETFVKNNIAISTDGITPTFYRIKRISSYWDFGYRKMFFELYAIKESNSIIYTLPYNEKAFKFLYHNRNEFFTIDIFNRIVGV